ncbi:MAG: metallophosphoesterase [Desulfovibrionaceae bacterium]
MPNNVDNTRDFLWIAVGDIHDDIARLSEIPELSIADGIIVNGDITLAGGVKQAERIMDVIQRNTPAVFAQIGNMDRSEITDFLIEKHWNIHREIRSIAPDVAIFGVGGSTFTPFGTPSEFPESHFATWLEELWPRAKKVNKTILVSHNPPKDTLCDVLPNGGHVGSTAVREFIEEAQPDICLCGHIHEARAIDRIGRTIVVNTGTLAAGGYAVIRLNKGRLSTELQVLPPQD